MEEPMKRRAIKWLLKLLVFALDKDDDLMAFSFSGGERKDYTVLVERFYDDGSYSVGTQMFPRNDVCIYDDGSYSVGAQMFPRNDVCVGAQSPAEVDNGED